MRKHYPSIAPAVFAALLFLFSLPVLGQGGTASLTGRVTDPSGLPLSGVKVQATNAQTGSVFNVSTNDGGLYKISNLPLGAYRLSLDKEGFEEVVRPGIELHVADVVAINVQ